MKRPLALIGFSYFFTLVALNHLTYSQTIIISAVLLLTLLISLIIKKIRVKKIFTVVFFACFVSSVVHIINFNLNIKPVQNLEGTSAKISGVICDIPYKNNNGYYHTLKIDTIDGKSVKPFKTILKCNSYLDADICDTFTGKVSFYEIENDPSFDFKLHYRSKDIYIKAYFNEFEEHNVKPHQNKTFMYYLLNLRREFSSNCRKIFKKEISSVVNAIFLGEKNTLSDEMKINFDRAGIYHLLSTCGIHISILAQIILWISKKFKINSKAANVLSAFSVLILMAFTGFTPSVTKSGIIITIYLLGKTIFRNSDSLNSLGIAVLLMCIFNPNYSCSVGLLLSTFSTLGIIFLYDKIKKKLIFKTKYNNLNKLIDYIASHISLGLSVMLFTIPVVVLYYGKISLISVISNLVVYPFAICILVSETIINILYLTKLTDFLVNLPAFICKISAQSIISISKLLSKISFSSIDAGYGVFYFCLACILILITISLYSKSIRKSIKITILISINLIIASTLSYQIHQKNVLRISLVPCNDGLSVVLSKNNRNAAILQFKEKTNTMCIQSYFSRCNIRNFDYVYASSTDNLKKSTFKNILKNYNFKNIVIPENDTLAQENFTESVNLESPIIYFKNKLTSKFWDDVSVEASQINDYVYIKISVSKIKILIIPSGGDANNLPESWKKCDFLILSGIPVDCQKIESKNIFISADKNKSKIGIYKLTENDINLYSLAHQGQLHINLYPNQKYQIWRLK